MIRGTTPTFTFKIQSSVPVTTLSEAFITFKQLKKVVLEKGLSDCTVDTENNTITLELSQAETLLFEESIMAEVQLRVRLQDNSALASDVKRIDVHRILKEGVI